ncbi:hypothetical protein F4803DRAFT_125656 [Xylaria telfairii]|nr:hypothetical protein F4803DRAFT_125656 [Xylaria telfairii]
MRIPLGIRAISYLRHGTGSRRPQCLNFARSIVPITATSNSGVETAQPVPATATATATASVQRALSSWHPGIGSRKPAPNGPKPKRQVPRLCPFNAYKATPYKLVKTYTGKLIRGHPMLIRNLPGFLNAQQWIDHVADRDGSFNASQTPQRKHTGPGFDALRDILVSAVTGRNRKGNRRHLDPAEDPANSMTLFDGFEAQCKIAQSSLEGDHPPLLMFRDWLQRSQFSDFSLDKTIAEILETHCAAPQQWIPFKAPLVFFRAVHQYNCEREKAAGTTLSLAGSTVHDQHNPVFIDGISGLVAIEEKMTEEFPFPHIVREIGQSTYNTKSCGIRVGVRPLRSDMRRYKHSTVVVGQLAGYSVVTLIPPALKTLNGLPLEFHERVPRTWDHSTTRFPLGSPSFALSGKTWTREFEDELSASGDILLATLIPGDGLLVPEGWWYGVRSINNGLQLHATVTWFLGRGEMPVGDQEEYNKGKYLKRFSPRVEI